MARHWTAEERAQQAQLIRKWKPWEKSTGAKTNQGKARSRRNAVTHGMSKTLRELRQALREHQKALEALRSSCLVGI